MYKYTAFANEIAGAVSLHPKTKWVYPHHTTSFNQEIIKTVIDLIALVSISMLAVDKYEKTKDKLRTVKQHPRMHRPNEDKKLIVVIFFGVLKILVSTIMVFPIFLEVLEG